MSHWRIAIPTMLCAMVLQSAICRSQAQGNQPNLGAQRFVEYCAGCHGADGSGGDKAPSLLHPSNTTAGSDADLIRVVSEGTTGGMPPFAQIGDANIQAVIYYLRTLQGSAAFPKDMPELPLPGDANAGRALYFGKGQCSTCHLMDGMGGFIAADLTSYGRDRTPDAILLAITSPDAPLVSSSRVASITTRAGKKLTGVLRNEDNFTVALQTEDGRYHLFSRSDLESVQYTSHSLMPRDYSSRLSPKELDDIVSFLMFTGRLAQNDVSDSRKSR
jgi:putative heme-binding domain-containing protein